MSLVHGFNAAVPDNYLAASTRLIGSNYSANTRGKMCNSAFILKCFSPGAFSPSGSTERPINHIILTHLTRHWF